MKQPCQKDEEYNLVVDEKLSILEQSTSTQSKQSNANLAMIQENSKNFKLKRTQKSLLQFNQIPLQRRGSQSCVEPIQIIQEEGDNYGRKIVYTVFWYDENIDNKYEIIVPASQDTLISDFIVLVIQEFNLQHEYIYSPFQQDGSLLYELYIPKKKNGKPNQDFPAFSDKTQLSKTNVTQFALKVSKLDSHYISSIPQSNLQLPMTKIQNENLQNQKCFWQKFFFCCNFDI